MDEEAVIQRFVDWLQKNWKRNDNPYDEPSTWDECVVSLDEFAVAEYFHPDTEK